MASTPFSELSPANSMESDDDWLVEHIKEHETVYTVLGGMFLGVLFLGFAAYLIHFIGLRAFMSMLLKFLTPPLAVWLLAVAGTLQMYKQHQHFEVDLPVDRLGGLLIAHAVVLSVPVLVWRLFTFMVWQPTQRQMRAIYMLVLIMGLPGAEAGTRTVPLEVRAARRNRIVAAATEARTDAARQAQLAAAITGDDYGSPSLPPSPRPFFLVERPTDLTFCEWVVPDRTNTNLVTRGGWGAHFEAQQRDNKMNAEY
mmetsp:Transcript_49473/g.140172  ORF Transcript_49473/g.140172 Transcript_49473/m.140172 type:complete len:255 (-) Transcript_49473:839-1603(-)